MRSIFRACADFERIRGRLKVAARVHQQFGVEEEAKEVVAEIVVAMDMPPAAGEGVVAQAARDSAGQAVQCARDAALVLEDVTVAQHEPGERHQIGCRPVAIHERLADADVAPRERAQEEPLVVHDEGRVEVIVGAESIHAVGTFQGERSAAQPAQARQKRRLRPLRDHAHRSINESV